MILSITLCVVALALVLAACRTGRSVGIPLAYVGSLLLVHLPGGIAHLYIQDSWSNATAMTAYGLRITSIGAIAFALGVWLATPRRGYSETRKLAPDRRLLLFCLIAGFVFTIAYPLVSSVPTLSAFVAKAGPIWIIAAAFGLKSAIERNNWTKVVAWSVLILIFPIYTLLSIGFLATASIATLIALAPSLLLIRRFWLSFVMVSTFAMAIITAFLNYFLSRDSIRAAVWGGASLEERSDRVLEAIRGFSALDLSDPMHTDAIDQRLNQNYFVGVAADRIDAGKSDYLYGQSILDGFLSLVPRVFWPDKPIASGSGDLVRNATGLWAELSETTSWGVGIVMELYINFGWLGITLGMLILGYILSRLDRSVFALAEKRTVTLLIPAYLVSIALIFPEGSFVDIIGGAGAALIVGLVLGHGYAAIKSSSSLRRRSRRQVY